MVAGTSYAKWESIYSRQKSHDEHEAEAYTTQEVAAIFPGVGCTKLSVISPSSYRASANRNNCCKTPTDIRFEAKEKLTVDWDLARSSLPGLAIFAVNFAHLLVEILHKDLDRCKRAD